MGYTGLFGSPQILCACLIHDGCYGALRCFWPLRDFSCVLILWSVITAPVLIVKLTSTAVYLNDRYSLMDLKLLCLSSLIRL